MKVIKKYFKVVMCFMAFALCSFLMVFAPTMTALSVEAAISNYAKTINSVHMPKQVDASKGLIIPFLTGDFAKNGYAIKVVDPAGYVHTAKVNGTTLTDDGDDYFTPAGAAGIQVVALTKGNYQIVYVVTEGTGDNAKDFYSNIYNVEVKNVSYELSFENENGTINLVKPEVAPSTNAIDRIEIPVPVAKNIDSDDDEGVKLEGNEISVSYNGTNVAKSSTGNTDFVEVEVEEGVYKYYIQPSKVGIYKIQYTYKRGVNRPTKTITIKVSENFKEPSEFKVSTAPSFDKFELGQTGVTLPKLTAKNEYQDDVAYNVKSIIIQKESDSNIKQELCAEKQNNYTFDMTLKAFGLNEETDSYDKLKGNYEIKYTLVDAYGKETSYTKRIEGVTVTSKPKIQMVYDYTATGSMKEGNFVTSAKVVNADTELQNKYGYDQIILPAAYAEDLVSKSNELIVVRYLRNVNTSTIYYVDNLKYNSSTGELEDVQSGDVGYNYSQDPNIGKINNAVQFKFSADADKAKNYDGTYQLEYRVIAKNIAKRETTLTISGSTKYTFTVLGYSIKPEDKTTPTVEITNVTNGITVDRNDELTVNFTAKDDDDTRLKNVVYYYYGDKSADSIAADITNRINLYNTDKSMHVLDNPALLTNLGTDVDTVGSEFEAYKGITKAELNEAGTGYIVKFDTTGDNKEATKATIVAISYNDYDNVSVDVRTVNFKKTGDNDKNAPALQDSIVWNDFKTDGTLADASKAAIGKTIILPELTYEDEDNTLLTNVSYYIDSPLNENTGLSYLSPSSKSYPGKKIIGGKIEVQQAGNYVVVYSATDDAGNTSITYFTFSVESEAKPLLAVNPVGKDITISGNTVTAEVGSTIAFDTILRAGDSKNIVTGTITTKIEDNGLDYSASGDRENSYIFNGVGTYTFTFKGTYAGKDSVEKVVNVNITAKKLEWLGEFDLPEYASMDSFVYLPDIAASNNAVVKVTVTPPNGSKLTEEGAVTKVAQDDDGNYGSFWRFRTNDSKGNYTIKYTATTADATLEKTFTIKVGDNVPPTIEFEHKAELEKDIVYDGSNQIQIKFDVKKTGSVADRYFKITASSNGETIYSYDLGLKITDITDGSSSATNMFWSDLKYEIIGDNGSISQDSENENLYLISGTGTYTIKLSIKDSNGNETVENIVFKVVTESEVEEKNDTVVGIVLIVISLVVLAGVILFFMLTGKKGGNKKSRKVVKQANAKAKKLEAKKEEVKVEAEVEETVKTETSEENTEAKEGEIEE